jgi:murein DD-endopeptidase MepM/ murein hydrolase activator NlpD
MKIAIPTKSYIIKVFSVFALIYLMVGTPKQANASFLDSVSSFIFGNGAQASEGSGTDNSTGSNNFGTDNYDYNSQNMQILGTESVDPNAKEVGDVTDVVIDNGALMPDSGLVGVGLESVSNGEMTTYEVKEGDTLSEIAMQFDISVNTIKWENNITGQGIKIGQKLNILPVTGVKHIIKKGDTLEKIATKYEADVEDIKVFNGVDSSGQLKVGDVIYVPNGVIKAVVQKPYSGKTNSGSSSSSSVKVESGYYMRPTSGPITSPYGPRRSGFHYGIDIGVSRGTSIVAAADGTVIETVGYCIEGKTSCGGRYGNYIMIKHSNGTITRYAHLSKVSVSVGQKVSKGKRIGSSGNTGHSTGPHLHFQIEKSNGSTIRPKF